MTELSFLNGATAIIGIIGDPIAQVKSPAGMTAGLAERGQNSIVVPFHVTRGHLAAFMSAVALADNISGMIVTVPHKLACFGLCASTSARAARLGAVNVMRRTPAGTWHGDMFDGEGFLAAQKQAGCRPEGKRALLVGAGGAGSAIALAFLEAGVAELAIHDGDTPRRDALIAQLAPIAGGRLRAGSPDPSGFDIIANATPAGMRAGDPLPVDVARLTPAMFVGDVITAPVETPLLLAARAKGCATQTGIGMFDAVRALMLDFYTTAMGEAA
ncbi:shikimate dehydrogenase [Acidocella sp.]|uniref:shikimate dehydrogenase family protein n=1 Tax=Acidocella sp. TaxID=50710 RepID=UPI002602950B|nr:shikimate dehydrogenase [Acidocella sp.]